MKRGPPPAWVRWGAAGALLLGALYACWAPSPGPRREDGRPCPTITRAEFEAALAAGAVRGTARVAADGTSQLQFGPGVVSCASGRGMLRPCKRPTELVIAYEAAGSGPFFVRVPAGAEYLFRPGNAPNTCEIVERR